MCAKPHLEKLGTVLWRIVPLVLVFGILCVLLAPEDFRRVKKVGFVLIYFAGLPFLIGSFVLLSEKQGWLK